MDDEPLMTDALSADDYRENYDYDDDRHDSEEKDVDEVLVDAGGFGWFQFILLCGCLTINISFAANALSMYFAADDPPWQCTANATSAFCRSHTNESIPQSSELFGKRCLIPRSEWKFTKPKSYSIVTEYDLTCGKQYLKSLTTSCFFIGSAVGSIVFGPITDIFGRRITIMIVTFIATAASLLSPFITAMWQFIVLRAFIGSTFGGATMSVYILLAECNTPKIRGIVANVFIIGFTVSQLVFTCLAYFVREWRHALLYFSFLTVFTFVTSFFYPESPNWLNAKGKIDKALKVLRKIAKMNGRSIESVVSLKQPVTDGIKGKGKIYSFYHLFNNLKVSFLVVLQCSIWFAFGVMFYALALESSNLGGDIYLNFVLSSLADLPGYLAVIVTSVYIGRKKTICVTFLIPSALILGIGFASARLSTLRITLAVISRILLTIGFNTVFIWSFELFPTILRSQGMNMCQIISRIGSAVAPFITDSLRGVSSGAPFFIMAGIGVVAAMLALILPETINKPTRQTYEDFFENHPSNEYDVQEDLD